MSPENEKPRRAGNTRGADAIANLRSLYGKPEATRGRKGWQSPSLPDNWRDSLPDPVGYYRAHVAKLGKPDAKGWAGGLCPFHDDHNPSFGAHVTEGGGWVCRAGCGGGDLVGFHMRRTGLAFRDAVADLIRWRA